MGVCDGRLQNARTQHTAKAIDYHIVINFAKVASCMGRKLRQSVVM